MNFETFDCSKISETTLAIAYTDLYEKVISDGYEPGGPGATEDLETTLFADSFDGGCCSAKSNDVFEKNRQKFQQLHDEKRPKNGPSKAPQRLGYSEGYLLGYTLGAHHAQSGNMNPPKHPKSLAQTRHDVSSEWTRGYKEGYEQAHEDYCSKSLKLPSVLFKKSHFPDERTISALEENLPRRATSCNPSLLNKFTNELKNATKSQAKAKFLLNNDSISKNLHLMESKTLPKPKPRTKSLLSPPPVPKPRTKSSQS